MLICCRCPEGTLLPICCVRLIASAGLFSTPLMPIIAIVNMCGATLLRLVLNLIINPCWRFYDRSPALIVELIFSAPPLSVSSHSDTFMPAICMKF